MFEVEDCKCTFENDCSIGIENDEIFDGREFFLKADLHDESEIQHKGDEGTLVILDFVARKKGLV